MFCPLIERECSDKYECAWYSFTANGCGMIEAALGIKSGLEELNHNLRELIPEKQKSQNGNA